MRGADAVIQRDVALAIALWLPAMVMSLGMRGDIAVQGMAAGRMRFGALRLAGRVESCRPQAHIRIEPEAQYGDQHDCDGPAPANSRLLRPCYSRFRPTP